MTKFRPGRGSILLGLMVLLTTFSCSKSTEKIANHGLGSSSNILEVDDSTAQKEIYKSDKPVFIEFYATWCGPCKILNPRVEKVANTLDSKVKFVKIDVEKAPNLVEKYKIESIPLMYFYSPKCPTGDPISGVRSKEEITAFINKKLEDCK